MATTLPPSSDDQARGPARSPIPPSSTRDPRSSSSSTPTTPTSATRCAGGSRSPRTPRGPTSRWRSTASRSSRGRRSSPAQGDTGIGFPVEYGGEGDVNRFVAGFETLALRRPVAARQGRRAVRPLRRRGPAPRHEEAPRQVPARRHVGRPPGLLRDDRERPRLERPVAAHDRDLRPGDRGDRRQHARRRRAQGLDRQRRRATAAWPPSSPSSSSAARSAACTACSSRSATRTASRCDGVRIEDCGAKLGLDGVDNGRLWFDQVRVPRDNLLDRYAEIRDDGTYFSAIENPTKRFFTMLGTLIQGRVSVCGAGIYATKVAQTIAVRHALRAPPVRAAGLRRGGRRSCGTGRISAGCCRTSRRPTGCTSRRRSCAARLHDVFTAGRRARPRPPRARDAGRRPEGDRDVARDRRRSRSAARRAAARATCARTASPRSRPTPTSSRRSRATTPSCSSSPRRTC